MIGSDISGLEDNSKQNFIYPIDPKYVNEMRVTGFDPHIDIGVMSGLLTKEDEEFFKFANDNESLTEEESTNFKRIKKIRNAAKQVNFSCVYGAGPPKIAETLKCDLDFATKLHTTYWERNKSVKLVAKRTKVKTINNQKWQLNPLNNFWYFLKAEKDRFSTLNQGAGSYIFDYWLKLVRNKLKDYDANVVLQYHDEILIICHKSIIITVKNILETAMEETNKQLNLNITIGISTSVGKNYAECH